MEQGGQSLYGTRGRRKYTNTANTMRDYVTAETFRAPNAENIPNKASHNPRGQNFVKSQFVAVGPNGHTHQLSREDGGMPTTYRKTVLGNIDPNRIVAPSNTYNGGLDKNPSNLTGVVRKGVSSIPTATGRRIGTNYTPSTTTGTRTPGYGRSRLATPTRRVGTTSTLPSTTSALPISTVPSNYTTTRAAPVSTVVSNPRSYTGAGPVVERKLLYKDPTTGLRMMKVCTPNGTIKRVECLDEIIVPEIPVNADLDPETESMIQDARDEFGRPEVEGFDCDDYPVKVEASKDGQFVFYGGESFGTLERRGGWLTNEGVVHYDRALSTLKGLPNGDIVVNDFGEGWDLCLLDEDFNEKERLEGLDDPTPGYYRMIKTRTGDDDNYILWMRGRSEISIVNTFDFSARHINNFWNYRGEEANAVAAAMDSEASRLVGIGFLPGGNEVQTIHVYDGGDGVSIFEGYDVLPEVGAWLCCEVSRQGDVFFLGGAEERRFEYGSAFLVAMSFDDEAELVNYARYGEDTKFHCINSLKRHPDGNILFAGCYGSIAVILWAGDQFHLIKSIDTVLNRPVTDLTYANNALYSVSDDNRGTAVYFDDRFLRNRDPRGPEPPHGMWRDLPKHPRRLTLADEYRARPRIPAKFAGAFRDYDIQRIALPGVDVTPDEKFIYVGKNELKVLEREGGAYKLLDNATHIKPFIDLKLLNSGEVITFDENTSDLIKYDPSLNEINRLQGAKKIDLDGTVLCMETSTDDQIFFAGGSSQFELTQGVAKVFAFTFDEDVDYICDLVLPNNFINTMGVSDIKRMDDTDVLFCGTNAAVFVVEWTGSHFVILIQVEEIHTWLVNSIDNVGKTIYTVSHKDEYVNRIQFTS